MKKRLAALSFSLLLCGVAAAAIATNAATAQPRGADNPMQLAQNNAAPPAAGARGRGPNRPTPTPAQRTERRGEVCREIAARAAGRFAELEVRLNLTAAQTGAFNRWRDQRLAAAKRMAETCATGPANARGPGRGGNAAAATSPVERLAQQETRLQRRLADIQAERPLLDALYGSLSAEQRQVLAREHGRGRMGMGGPGNRGMGGMFRRGRMGMNGPMERGPMGRGPGRMGGPGNEAPPQFPQ